MAPTILVADDDVSIGTVLGQALKRAGYVVRVTARATELREWVEQGLGDLIVIDVIMPDGNGLDLLAVLRVKRPDLRAIVISAESTFVTAIKAAQAGAIEYLPKPFDLQHFLHVVEQILKPENVIERPSLKVENIPLIGRSSAMQEVYRTMARLSNLDLSVMLIGESGTGKKIVAKTLHDYSKWSQGPFVILNLASVSRENIVRELLGQESTQAEEKIIGKLAQAEGGTLFLEEIGDMPMEAQMCVLRILQEGAYTPLGGQKSLKVNIRIMASTQKDLRVCVESGALREDLYYRLNVVPLRLPPLRERREDIQALITHFLEKATPTLPVALRQLDRAVIQEIQDYTWPGNVRELENFVKRLIALYPRQIWSVKMIQENLPYQMPMLSHTNGYEQKAETNTQYAESLDAHLEKRIKYYLDALEDHQSENLHGRLYDIYLAEVEKPLINMVLDYTHGNQIKAAALLGMNRNTLRKKIRDLGLVVTRRL